MRGAGDHTWPCPEYLARTCCCRTVVFQFFNVAIGSAEAAIEAVRQKVGASHDAPIRVVRSLSVVELAAAGPRSGQIKPA